MSKVLTFSTTFPSYHLRKGEPTLFVEKIFAGLADILPGWAMPKEFNKYDWHEYYNCHSPKFHTIRAGKRWKAGDTFSPRIWSGRPYYDKQIKISSDLEVKKTWEFDMEPAAFLDECRFYINGTRIYGRSLSEVAKNDGLHSLDFIQWFAGPGLISSKRKPFSGQIICWNGNINY